MTTFVVIMIVLLIVALYDVTQRNHAILRAFPVVGHFRYWLESVGPELRQYIVTGNDEERPFSRDERRWVYTSSKHKNNYFGFGSDNDMERTGSYLIIKHSVFPLPLANAGEPGYDATHALPCAKVMGGPRGRARAFRPASIVNISAMSFGSLSSAAVRAMNDGSRRAGCLQNTGEGGVSQHHRQGGELVWQIGTGYFGCREPDGRFSLSMLKDTVTATPTIRAIEIKLSQGAKPGVGGILPGAKVTPEIAAARGIPVGQTCISPNTHSAFGDVDSLLDFAELLADETGLPVGIKSAVGDGAFWAELGRLMASGARGVDFVTVDGGEGGTGAGPLVFTDHVALPFKQGFARVFRELAEQGVAERVVMIGSGKLGFPDTALLAMGLGCDMLNVAREAMLAVGCIQAQRCHSGHCPTGIATHNPWLVRGLVPDVKAERLANYVLTLRQELLKLARVCGAPHPALVDRDRIELLDGRLGASTIEEHFGYRPGLGLPGTEAREQLAALMGAAPGSAGRPRPR